jgi:hypothetical protein
MVTETPDEPAEAPAARYQGDGSQFVSGVPARDLTHAEYEALTDEQRDAVLTTRGPGGALIYDVEGEEQPDAEPDAEPEPGAPAPAAAPAPEGEPEA